MQERVTQAIAMIVEQLDVLAGFEEVRREAYDNEVDDQVDWAEGEMLKHGLDALRRVKHLLETGEYPEGTFPESVHELVDGTRAEPRATGRIIFHAPDQPAR